MPARPEIFISATSTDLKSCRQIVRDALLTLGCMPVVQDHFPPAAGEVRTMLRERIAGCHAVIHLAGECYGFEPQERGPNEGRRSYTQMEYDIARELKKPLYTFLCALDFPYDAHEPEDDERRRLQEQHRAALAAGDQLYQPIKDTAELNLRVRELQTRVEALSKDLQKTRSWLGRGLAAGLVSLALVGGVLWFQHRRVAQNEQKVAQVSDELDRYRQAVKALADSYGKDIEPGRKLTDQEKFDRALAAVAAQQHVSVGELQTWMGIFVAQVRTNPAADFYDRALADFAEKHFADAAANATRAADEYRAQREAAEKEAASAGARAVQARTKERLALTLVGDSEMAAGHYAATVEPYRQALALTSQDQEPLDWCEAAARLTEAFSRMGRYGDAEPLARAVVARRTALLGGENPATLVSVNSLAKVLLGKGDYPAAEALFRRCLETRERTLGREHPDTLSSVNGLALMLWHKGDLAAAEPLLRRCVEAQERTLGPDHPDTLISINNLANVLQDKSDYAAAEPLFRRCLEARERTLGPDHPATLLSVNNLAILLYSKGDLAAAEPLYRRCLEAQERTLGPDHPNTLASVNNLAILLDDKADYAAAEPLLRRCLETRERTLGKEHPDTLSSLTNLANLLSAKGDLVAAEPLYRRCLEAQERTLGPENTNTLVTDGNLAQVLDAKGDDAAAEALYLRAEAGMTHAMPPEHPYRLDLDYHFSLLRQKQGRLAEALALVAHAAEGARKTFPPDNPDRLSYEKNLQALRAKLAGALPSPAAAEITPTR